MAQQLRERLFQEIDSWTLIDPHTHINPHSPASTTLADVLGYHYYTELAHSAGMAKDQIEEPGLDPKEKVARLVRHLGPIENTIQYSWLIEMCQRFFGLKEDRLTEKNWEKVYDHSAKAMAKPKYAQEILKASRIESVFLTNDFDDPLEGFDSNVYIPCLRTDELVFKMNHSAVQERLQKSTGISVTDLPSLREALGAMFQRFIDRGARACAISLPPNFSPRHVPPSVADRAFPELLRRKVSADSDSIHMMSLYVFWTLAELCDEHKLPFDLMIGVNRNVYLSGVHQGQDLYDSRVS
ncbi:MAG: glucuronate isomerase, partial [Pirellulales bacterium]